MNHYCMGMSIYGTSSINFRKNMIYFYLFTYTLVNMHLDGYLGSNDENTATLSGGNVTLLPPDRLTLTPLPPTCMITKHTTCSVILQELYYTKYLKEVHRNIKGAWTYRIINEVTPSGVVAMEYFS